MLYAALIWIDDENPRPGGESELDDYVELGRRASSAGVLQGGQALHPAEIATTVRFRDDQVLLTDGPFIESKEQINGFMLFECDSLDEAIDWAAQIPGARHGAIEVRPVLVHD